MQSQAAQGAPSQPSAHAPASGVGFAQTQLLTLRRQIVCFKELKRWRSGERQEPLRPDELTGLQPPPLLPPLPPGAAPAAPAAASAAPPAAAFPVPGQALPQAQLQPGMQFPGGMAMPGAGVPGMVTPAALAAAQQQQLQQQQLQQQQLQQQQLQQQQQAAAQAAAVAAAQQAQAAAAAAAAQQQQQQAAAQAAAQQAAAQQAAQQQAAQQQAAQQSQQSQGAPAMPQARQSARNSGQGPIFTLAAAPRGGHFQPPAPQSGFLRPQQVRFDVAGLLQAEYQRLLANKAAQRRKEIEAARAAPADQAAPGFRYRSQLMPIGRAALEELRLKLQAKQAAVRADVQREQEEVLQMNEKKYRMMLRQHRSSRIELARKELAAKAEVAAQRAKEAAAHRKELIAERCNAARDARNLRNRGVLRQHERLVRERNKAKDDDRAMRLEALKAHDFEAYQEMLAAKAGLSGAPAAGERYEQISKFLADTEEYLHKLAAKIASVKMAAEMDKAAKAAAEDARAKGMTEEDVQAAAHAAAEDAAMSNDLRRSATGAVDAQSRYYALAHSNTEEIVEQPKLLRPPNGATLREYQIVGLQWMVSLYNNHLNGLLADEMGLGKTVQVMSLIAYLMEKKQNFGPHLIIVPNAVIVNWKSELTQWLPAARCVYYVGNKDERARKYAQEVQSLQFNILVTTYEFIMRDRSRLSKVDWQYIIIDEAQRMKDRQSKLARDLERFKAARRLLLSGTPLQNDLQELWSLLNLLLPEVFDDKKMFAEWFGEAIASTQAGPDADWLEMEKRVVVIHRLHQILEPFMLRRQVEDVESKLPPKVPVVVKVAPSPYQSCIYSWIKASGTIRLDPSAPFLGKFRREYASLNNKCMELRKVCNHPMLSYPPESWAVGDAIVRQCGKMLVLDRFLVKMKLSGHRVLLFSTMTKLLDLLEVYLRWRQLPEALGGGTMQYLRIDGSTTLEDRESAIQKFNAKDSEAFIFLLSIRAAGRGLNLQSSDTVVIYDPDPNPKNEEQAIARSHRIGQSKEVRVIHLESVADAGRGSLPRMEDLTPDARAAVAAGKTLYADSIESLVRNEIQRTKIEMANEVIDAGRFDQQTSMEERRHTLEALLQDEDRNKRAENVVPSWTDLNRSWARTEAEFELFERLDRELPWFTPTTLEETPPWMRWSPSDLPGAQALSMRHAPDVTAELAALTGTVLHNHQAPLAQTRHQLAQQERQRQAAAQAAAQPPAWRPAPAPAEPEPTTTTNLSSLGGGEEGEEVEFGNDEEEEVLDQNIITDETEYSMGGSAGAAGTTGMLRVPSTAGTVAQAAAAAGAAGDAQVAAWAVADGVAQANGEGEDGEEPPHKRQKKGLSVHFAEGEALAQHPAGGADGQQQQQQQPAPPDG